MRILDLQVHHIKWRSQLGDDANENLITLCVTCHRHIHRQARAFSATEMNEGIETLRSPPEHTGMLEEDSSESLESERWGISTVGSNPTLSAFYHLLWFVK